MDCEDVVFQEHKKSVEKKLQENSNRIDSLVSGRYTPFFATAGFFLVLSGGLWQFIRAVEREVDVIDIRVALAVADTAEVKRMLRISEDQHIVVHRRERENLERVRDFVKAEYGITIKPQED